MQDSLAGDRVTHLWLLQLEEIKGRFPPQTEIYRQKVLLVLKTERNLKRKGKPQKHFYKSSKTRKYKALNNVHLDRMEDILYVYYKEERNV